MNATETKVAHTPGPWIAEGFKGLVVNGSDGVTLALCPGDVKSNGLANVQANAKLIAAAPELLAACRNLVFQFEHMDDPADQEAIDEALAAIARATT